MLAIVFRDCFCSCRGSDDGGENRGEGHQRYEISIRWGWRGRLCFKLQKVANILIFLYCVLVIILYRTPIHT